MPGALHSTPPSPWFLTEARDLKEGHPCVVLYHPTLPGSHSTILQVAPGKGELGGGVQGGEIEGWGGREMGEMHSHWTHGHTHRQTDRHTDRHTDTHTHTHTHTHIHSIMRCAMTPFLHSSMQAQSAHSSHPRPVPPSRCPPTPAPPSHYCALPVTFTPTRAVAA